MAIAYLLKPIELQRSQHVVMPTKSIPYLDGNGDGLGDAE